MCQTWVNDVFVVLICITIEYRPGSIPQRQSIFVQLCEHRALLTPLLFSLEMGGFGGKIEDMLSKMKYLGIVHGQIVWTSNLVVTSNLVATSKDQS